MFHARLHHPASFIIILTLVIGTCQLVVSAQDVRPQAGIAPAGRLAPTNHPLLPGDPALYLFVPNAPSGSTATRAVDATGARLVRAVALIRDRDYTAALSVLSDVQSPQSPLYPYAKYYTALALKGLGRVDEADASLIALTARGNIGYLDEAVPRLRAELALAKDDPTTAVAVLESITPSRAADPEVILAQLGRAAERAGDLEKAVRAYRRVHFEYPLSSEAEVAGIALARLQPGRSALAEFLPLDIERAETLFAARRWSAARDAFQAIGRSASLDEQRELAGLRVAECDFYLNKTRQAREGLRPYLDQGSRQVEARYFALAITKALGENTAYVTQARRFVQDVPTSAWTEETLNTLATHFIVSDDDDSADLVFRDLLQRFPTSRYAERAAWKVGWASYRAGRFAEAAQVFDSAAAYAPRADFRPAWLYWSARAHDQIEDLQTANARYRLAATDYLNSYYGRLASRRLVERRELPVPQSVSVAPEGMPLPLIPTNLLVRELLGLGLYEDALHELDYASRAWGDSAAIQATTAWIRHHRAGQFVAMERFQNLRGAITQMKRAYPHYLASGGEALPPDVLKIIFPLDYWPLIKAQADERGLDPYLMAALVAQESTFTADIRSSANAFGLMQLIPATARRYAAKVGIRVLDLHPDQAGDECADGDDLLQGPDGPVRRSTSGSRQLQRRRAPRRPVARRTSGPSPGRIHRRHPIPRNAELREAHHRHRRGLSAPLRWGHPHARTRFGGAASSLRRVEGVASGGGNLEGTAATTSIPDQGRPATPALVHRRVGVGQASGVGEALSQEARNLAKNKSNSRALMEARLELTRKAVESHFWYRGFRRYVLPALEAAAGQRRGLRLLDCGSGTGHNLTALARYGYAVGMDVSLAGVALARSGGHGAVGGDVARLPFAGAAFDVVTSFDVLQMVADDGEAVREMARVLRPGGSLVLTLAALDILHGDHSVVWDERRRYTPSSARTLTRQAGLTPTRVSFLFASLFPIMLVSRTLQRLTRGMRRHISDASDISVPFAPVNTVLSWLVSGEAALARVVPMPIGSTLLVVARKPDGRI